MGPGGIHSPRDGSRESVFALYEREGLAVGRTVVSARHVKQVFTSLRVALTDR